MIDLSKKYRTVHDREVVLLNDKGPWPEFPIVGYLVGSMSLMYAWGQLGKSANSAIFDLVEVKETTAVRFWINTYRDFGEERNDSYIFNNQEDAIKDADRNSQLDSYKCIIRAGLFEVEVKI